MTLLAEFLKSSNLQSTVQCVFMVMICGFCYRNRCGKEVAVTVTTSLAMERSVEKVVGGRQEERSKERGERRKGGGRETTVNFEFPGPVV